MVSEKKRKRILLGEITGVHGIRGDLLVRSYTQPIEAVASYGPLSDEHGTKTLSLSVVRVTDKGIVARIEGIKDRTTAEDFRGTKLFIDRTQLPEADASEFYHADLIGLDALAPDGSSLGVIVSVQNFGGGDLLELKPVDGSSSEFIPFKSEWVPSIDLAARTATVIIPATSGGDSEDEEATIGDAPDTEPDASQS